MTTLSNLPAQLQQHWLSNARADLLAGLVVALALIPESIAFSIIAGVDPKVGLYASVCIAIVTSLAGGRPAMISAATGAMALVMVSLVKEHGIEYMFAATILTGVIQMVAGFLRVGSLLRFISRAVVVGFVNALAILVFMAQMPELVGVHWHTYAALALGLGIVHFFPKVPKLGALLPSPLVAIVVLTLLSVTLGLELRTVGDKGDLPSAPPSFWLPQVPFGLETLRIIFPYSLSLAMVGLLESLLTATILDEMTETDSDKNRESKGQGLANVVAGFFGGMAGCAMIGQSVISVSSGGRTRLATLSAGVFLLLLIVFSSDVLRVIPMAALVAVMIVVSLSTFNWASVRELKTHPISFNVVMLVTVAVVVGTHNLAYGVLVGVLLSALFFANKIGRYMFVRLLPTDDGSLAYGVVGQVFFASADELVRGFDYHEAAAGQTVSIDLSNAHFWDVTAVSALDKVVLNFRKRGAEVAIFGLNEASRTMVDRFGTHDKPERIDIVGPH